MKTELENTVLRKVIDKAYNSGYNEAIRRATEWLEKNAENYVWWLEGDGGMSDEFIEDFINALKNK